MKWGTLSVVEKSSSDNRGGPPAPSGDSQDQMLATGRANDDTLFGKMLPAGLVGESPTRCRRVARASHL